MLVFFMPFVAHAAESPDVYSVSKVKVYAESDSLDNARREALNQGIRDSFEIILKRVLPHSLHWKLDQIRQETAYDVMQEYKTSDERMTSNSYMATVDITFNGEEITKKLNLLGAKYATNYTGKFLVITNLTKKFQPIKSEAWDKIWENAPDEFGLVRFTYPINDLEDFYVLSNLNKDVISLQILAPLLKKYEATGAYFISSNIKSGQVDSEILEVTADGIEQLNFPYKMDDKLSDEDNYKHLMLTLYEYLDEKYKGVNKFAENETYRSRLVSLVPDAKSWAHIREQLEFVGGVQDVEIVKMNKSQVIFDLVYNVDPEYLSINLKSDNFRIFEEKGVQLIELVIPEESDNLQEQ